jgi:mannose-6-phosphate isomerase-like protein (cupin superfamily)
MTAVAIATAAPKTAAARLRVVRTAEEIALPFGDHAGFPLCAAEHTGGEFTLAVGEFPAASGTSPHIHHREDEYFYVLEGTFTAYVGGQAHLLTPGTFALLPKDVPHCFRNTGGTHGRMLIGFTPSGFEKMFAAMTEATAHVPAGTRHADMLPILAEVTAKFGVTMLPPAEGDLAAGTLHPDTRPEDLARVRVLKTGEGRRTISLDHGVTRKAVSADTNGELAWMVCDAMPGAGTPPHIHHREDEQFFVLSARWWPGWTARARSR